jgi:hypothetical protein
VAPPWKLIALSLCLAGSAPAQADARGLALSLGISGADGTVRAQANVKLAVSAAPGSPDFAVAMGTPVRERMGEIRTCFGEAVARAASAEGRAQFEIEALPHGKTRARVQADQTGDKQMVECMRASLSRATLTGVPAGARSLVTLDLVNPSARLRSQLTARNEQVPLKVLPSGRAESEGATQQGEIQFRITGSVRARRAIEALHRDVTTRLAGLLDCRRKASRHGRSAHGSVTVDLKLDQGRIARARPTADRSIGHNAPTCVVEWMNRADPSQLQASELELTVMFSE